MSVLDRLLGPDGRDLLFDVMSLLMIADGEIRESEIAKFGTLVSSRPEFRGLDPDEVLDRFRQAVERTTRNIAAGTLDERVGLIAEKLPTRSARLLAFGMATAIALADEEAHPNEIGLLKIFERAFELTETEVKGVVRCVRENRPIEELFWEKEDEHELAYVEAMTLAIAADGRVNRAEVRALTEEILACPELGGLSLERGESFVQRALDAVDREGLEARLSALGRALVKPAERFTAYILAVKMVLADGQITDEERHLLARMEALFALSPEDTRRARDIAEGNEEPLN